MTLGSGEGLRQLTREEAVEKALLFTFQLSGKDYRKMQAALSEVAFIRALEQDSYTVAALDTGVDLEVERLARALIDSNFIQRYDEYSRAAHPDTMRDSPLDELARSWAEAVAAAYREKPCR